MNFEYSEQKCYQKGDTIITQGEVSDDIYVIIKGKAKIIKAGEDGGEIVVDIIDEGKVFGELGFILEQPRNRTVKALTDMEVEVIDPRVFGELYNLEYARLIRPLLQTMAERLRFTDARLAELQHEKVFYAEKGTSTEKRFSISIQAKTRQAVESMNGKNSIEVVSFPLYVGRYSRRRSDDMFHSNNLFLLDEPPYLVSRSHFSVIRFNNDLYFHDRGSMLGSWVNGEQIGGDPYAPKKKMLKFGENIVLLGGENSKLKFTFTTHIE
ncbi:MAG: cyclic nucleotide-binding domain-containing protein [Candidatus Cloacimonetes bacterium]|nr:cyclic nucleotide-binding domain-containing protein [Candidatus Cloacimonadota bacterium]